MRKEKRERRPRRRCHPAETTSCTSWPFPGNWSLPWFLPLVSPQLAIVTLKMQILMEEIIYNFIFIHNRQISLSSSLSSVSTHLMNSRSGTWELNLTKISFSYHEGISNLRDKYFGNWIEHSPHWWHRRSSRMLHLPKRLSQCNCLRGSWNQRAG